MYNTKNTILDIEKTKEKQDLKLDVHSNMFTVVTSDSLPTDEQLLVPYVDNLFAVS